MNMKLLNTIYNHSLGVLTMVLLTVLFSSCDKTESYSELLKEEEKACNWFLAQQIVCNEIPEDGEFEIGENAPFYKMDKDGYIYMQVINKGDNQKAKNGDIVYFRFNRSNLKNMYNSLNPYPEGNSEDLNNEIGNTSFVYGNNRLPSTTQWGSGIQVPLKYIGYNSEVNLVLRSYYGFSVDQSSCLPYIVNIRYFKPVY